MPVQRETSPHGHSFPKNDRNWCLKMGKRSGKAETAPEHLGGKALIFPTTMCPNACFSWENQCSTVTRVLKSIPDFQLLTTPALTLSLLALPKPGVIHCFTVCLLGHILKEVPVFFSFSSQACQTQPQKTSLQITPIEGSCKNLDFFTLPISLQDKHRKKLRINDLQGCFFPASTSSLGMQEHTAVAFPWGSLPLR